MYMIVYFKYKHEHVHKIYICKREYYIFYNLKLNKFTLFPYYWLEILVDWKFHWEIQSEI